MSLKLLLSDICLVMPDMVRTAFIVEPWLEIRGKLPGCEDILPRQPTQSSSGVHPFDNFSDGLSFLILDHQLVVAIIPSLIA